MSCPPIEKAVTQAPPRCKFIRRSKLCLEVVSKDELICSKWNCQMNKWKRCRRVGYSVRGEQCSGAWRRQISHFFVRIWRVVQGLYIVLSYMPTKYIVSQSKHYIWLISTNAARSLLGTWSVMNPHISSSLFNNCGTS